MLIESRALRLLAVVDQVEVKATELADAIAARDDTIRNLLLLGSSPSDIAQVAGMSRGRVYQIKAGK